VAGLPGQFKTRLEGGLSEAFSFAEKVAKNAQHERFSRVAAGKLYHALSVLLAAEGGLAGMEGGDARRMVMARFVLEHRLHKSTPMQLSIWDWEEEAISALLSDEPVSLDDAASMLVA
jgi:acyl-CoA dehydrogenase